jgi:molybdopterin-binding protein
VLGDRVRVQVTATPALTAEVMPGAVDELNLDDGGQLCVRPAGRRAGVSAVITSSAPPQFRLTEQELIHMEMSARNQLKGTVTGVKSGAVMAEVTVRVNPGEMTAAITDSSRDRLHLKEGDEVSVIIKATEVMIATG